MGFECWLNLEFPIADGGFGKPASERARCVCERFPRPYARGVSKIRETPSQQPLHAIPAGSPLPQHGGFSAKKSSDARSLAGMSALGLHREFAIVGTVRGTSGHPVTGGNVCPTRYLDLPRWLHQSTRYRSGEALEEARCSVKVHRDRQRSAERAYTWARRLDAWLDAVGMSALGLVATGSAPP
jgi:hypothetical protein